MSNTLTAKQQEVLEESVRRWREGSEAWPTSGPGGAPLTSAARSLVRRGLMESWTKKGTYRPTRLGEAWVDGEPVTLPPPPPPVPRKSRAKKTIGAPTVQESSPHRGLKRIIDAEPEPEKEVKERPNLKNLFGELGFSGLDFEQLVYACDVGQTFVTHYHHGTARVMINGYRLKEEFRVSQIAIIPPVGVDTIKATLVTRIK